MANCWLFLSRPSVSHHMQIGSLALTAVQSTQKSRKTTLEWFHLLPKIVIAPSNIAAKMNMETNMEILPLQMKQNQVLQNDTRAYQNLQRR